MHVSENGGASQSVTCIADSPPWGFGTGSSSEGVDVATAVGAGFGTGQSEGSMVESAPVLHENEQTHGLSKGSTVRTRDEPHVLQLASPLDCPRCSIGAM